MSKINLEQVQRARMLVEGLRKNYSQVNRYGISAEEITRLEQLAGELEKLDGELEALRTEVSNKVGVTNHKLAEVKSGLMSAKQIVKRNFDPESWKNFGVMDKR